MVNCEKKTVYSVTFNWGGDSYRSKFVGVRSVSIGITDATNKFDALSKAFELVKSVVGGVEPEKMNVNETCE